MEETKQVVEEVSTDNKETKPEVKEFEYGDLMLHCGVCDYKDLLQSSVKGGLQFNPLLTKSDQHITLACRKCGAKMSLMFEEGIAPKEVKNEQISEENKEEVSNKGTSENSK